MAEVSIVVRNAGSFWTFEVRWGDMNMIMMLSESQNKVSYSEGLANANRQCVTRSSDAEVDPVVDVILLIELQT